MQNSEHYRGKPRTLGTKVKEFLAWLRGPWTPKYVPQKSRYRNKGKTIPKPDFGS